MISPEAVELNASFRRDIKDSGQFNQPVDEVRANWDEFGRSVPEYSPDVAIDPVDCDGVASEWVVAPGVDDKKVLLHWCPINRNKKGLVSSN